MAPSDLPSSNHPGTSQAIWTDRRVIVALTGGIACYKMAYVVSQLVQNGAAVRVMMTEAATRFVAPLTYESLSGSPVTTSIWQSHGHHESPHVELAGWCDLHIIAPATANSIAKLASGIHDDAVSLTTCALPQTTPVLLAPAMNEQMWMNPVTQRNLATVKQVLGYHLVGPGEGWQACRTQGPGRMSEPDEIIAAAAALLTQA